MFGRCDLDDMLGYLELMENSDKIHHITGGEYQLDSEGELLLKLDGIRWSVTGFCDGIWRELEHGSGVASLAFYLTDHWEFPAR